MLRIREGFDWNLSRIQRLRVNNFARTELEGSLPLRPRCTMMLSLMTVSPNPSFWRRFDLGVTEWAMRCARTAYVVWAGNLTVVICMSGGRYDTVTSQFCAAQGANIRILEYAIYTDWRYVTRALNKGIRLYHFT